MFYFENLTEDLEKVIEDFDSKGLQIISSDLEKEQKKHLVKLISQCEYITRHYFHDENIEIEKLGV
tara:strand:+ start:896 stop:1093 length:198 start_codon:yes stop_codon:yes gene_type:complete